MAESKRVALYIRVSTEHQIKGDSLQEQQDTLKNHINENDNLIIHDTYIDGGVSGQKIDRDEFNRLLSDIKNGDIDLIIFTKLDRWFRSLKHYLNTQDLLEKYKVDWLAVSQPFFNTDTAHGRAFVANSMTWAELEAQMASERIKSVFANKIAHGEVISGKIPLGYSISEKKLVLNHQSEKVKLIFDHYNSWNSLNKTVQYMEHELGIIRDQQSLKRLLKNEKYIGHHRGNSNYCPPIIDNELFYSVQSKLPSNVKNYKKRTYIFSGLLKCAECERKYTGKQNLSKLNEHGIRGTINCYRCNFAHNLRRCENRKYITEYKFEESLLNRIQPLIKEFIKENELQRRAPKNNSINKNDIKKKMERLKTAYLNEIISLEEFRIDREKFEKLLNKSEDASQIIDYSNLNRILELDLKSFYPNLSDEEKQQFWRSFIDHISIGIDRQLQITFK